METGEPLFPHTFRELAHIPNVSPPMNYHSLIVERDRGLRHREFILFHGEYVYPEYLLAYRRCLNGTVVALLSVGASALGGIHCHCALGCGHFLRARTLPHVFFPCSQVHSPPPLLPPLRSARIAIPIRYPHRRARSMSPSETSIHEA